MIEALQTLAPATAGDGHGGRLHQAAHEFEALLVTELIRAARTGEDGEDQAAGTALSLAEEQFARAISQAGGLGLADLIAAAVEPKP